jgi:hypothetical protein
MGCFWFIFLVIKRVINHTIDVKIIESPAYSATHNVLLRTLQCVPVCTTQHILSVMCQHVQCQIFDRLCYSRTQGANVRCLTHLIRYVTAEKEVQRSNVRCCGGQPVASSPMFGTGKVWKISYYKIIVYIVLVFSSVKSSGEFMAKWLIREDGCNQGRSWPVGQPGQSEQLAPPPPPIHKNFQKMRIFAILWQQRVYWTNGGYIARLDV